MNIILAGTGHRPDKLGGYGSAVTKRTYSLALSELKRIRPDIVISGMALGWDQALMQAAIDLKIEAHAYVPFKGQENKWPLHQKLYYDSLLTGASKVKFICEGDYAAWKMGVRNERMVRDCTHVLALWNGSSGGTAHMIMAAKRENRPVHNCWDTYVNGVLQRNLELVR
jgi:uncharacterized phage-like protein YoqJ